jgi:hypothetical protein
VSKTSAFCARKACFRTTTESLCQCKFHVRVTFTCMRGGSVLLRISACIRRCLHSLTHFWFFFAKTITRRALKCMVFFDRRAKFNSTRLLGFSSQFDSCRVQDKRGFCPYALSCFMLKVNTDTKHDESVQLCT